MKGWLIMKILIGTATALRWMVRLGLHGKAHQRADKKLVEWMHNNGLGA